MKIGARNKIVGKISEIKKGSLMSQVKVSVDGPIDLTSVMTLDSLAELGVKQGDTVRVVVKAVSVLLVREYQDGVPACAGTTLRVDYQSIQN
jgi:molybdopterin-binding protein